MTRAEPDCCELRPRDFSARLMRRVRGVGARRRARHRGRRAILLGAVFAGPAMAAAHGWSVAGGPVVAPISRQMPDWASSPHRERPDPILPWRVETAWPETGAFNAAAGPPPARLPAAHSPEDRMRALTCLTQAVYFEAAREPDAGQRAVAQVVLNRVAHPAYPNTVCGVVYQGSERATGCQFTFTCDGALARTPDRRFWQRAESVARAALAGYVHAPAGLATHYHTTAVHPYWAGSLRFIGTVGAHRFYRFGGPAGEPATFRPALYRGGEPPAQPHPRGFAPTPGDITVDPVAIVRAFAPGSALRPVLPVPAPFGHEGAASSTHVARGLPGAAAVRPEYSGSGRWIASPGPAKQDEMSGHSN